MFLSVNMAPDHQLTTNWSSLSPAETKHITFTLTDFYIFGITYHWPQSTTAYYNLGVETIFLEPLHCWLWPPQDMYGPLPVSLLQMFCITFYWLLSTHCIHLMFAYTYRLPAVSFKSNGFTLLLSVLCNPFHIPHLNSKAIMIIIWTALKCRTLGARQMISVYAYHNWFRW